MQNSSMYDIDNLATKNFINILEKNFYKYDLLKI